MVKLFETTEYLNLEPVTEVRSVHFTLYMPDDVSKLSDEEKLKLYEPEKTHQYLRALTKRLLKMSLEKRGAEMLKPVTKVELSFLNHMRKKRNWNFSPSDLEALGRSAVFRRLVLAAKFKGFTGGVNAKVFHNGYGNLYVRLSLEFYLNWKLLPEGQKNTALRFTAGGRTWRKDFRP